MVMFHEAVETMVVLLGIFLIRRTKLEGSQAVMNTTHSLIQGSEFSLWLYKALMKF